MADRLYPCCDHCHPESRLHYPHHSTPCHTCGQHLIGA